MGRGKQAGSEGLDTGTYKDLLVPAGALASSVAGAGRGVLSQSLGLPGDLEGLGREGLNWLGKNYSDEFTPYGELPPSKKTNILSDDTFLPKTEEYRDKILPQIGEDTYAKLGSYSPVAPGVYLNAIKQGAKGVKAANKGVKALKIKPESFDKTKTSSDTVDESRRKFIKNTGILAASAALPAAVKGLHGLEEARGIKALEEVAPVARNAAHLRNLALLRSAREAWKAKITKIGDDFFSSSESDFGNNPMYDDESALRTRLNAIAREQNLIPDARKQLLENGYENPIQTIYNKHKDALDALESQGEKELRIKQKELGKDSSRISGVSSETKDKKYKIFYEELKSMFGDDIPKEYMRDVDRYINLTDRLDWFSDNKPFYISESMHPSHPDYNKNSITAMILNDRDHINFDYEDQYKSGGIVNDPMNPMGQVQTTSPMNPMGLGTPQQQAYGLASLGRNNDSMLVHMTPKEVASLQDMAMAHGGSLTTNPNTGLPEAGFLDSILPAIVGIGAAVAAPMTGGLSLGALGSVGSLLANPLITGGLAGLGAMIANGGDWREGLKWGLGVGAGTGLGNGIQSMVTPVTKVGENAALSATTSSGAGYGAMTPAQQVAADVAAEPAKAGMFQNFLPVPPSTAASFGGQTASKLLGTGLPAAAKLGGAGLASMAMQRPEPLKIRQSQDDKDYGPGGKYEYKGPYTYPDYGPVTYATPEELEQGIEHNYFGENYNRPPQYVPARKEGGPIGMAEGGSTGEQMYFPQSHFSAGMTGGGAGTPANLQAAGNALRNYFSGLGRPGTAASPQLPPWQQINASGQVQNTRAPTQDEMDFANTARRPYYGFAMGNTGSYTDNWLRANQRATQNQAKAPTVGPPAPMTTNQGGYSDLGEQMFFTPSYFSAGMSPGYASGGIASLPGAATAGGMTEGLLNGPGDGMSDSIPATIDGKQEARLATGEFVIPADVVSHLGNGATEPGAKVLYAMMDRVRQARTGNPKQGKEIEPEKFLPA